MQLVGWVMLVAGSAAVLGEAPPTATAAFDRYTQGIEARLARRPAATNGCLAPIDRLREGNLVIDKIVPPVNPPGAMLHHWRGTAFAPGATAAGFEQLMRNFQDYPRHYAPQIVAARVLHHDGDRYRVKMRVEQKHVLTVVLDTDYDVTFARLDPSHGYSISRSTRIDEIDAPGTPRERALSADEEHGFLWRLNTYWTYEERDGGLYLQIETISLTRPIPAGLVWAIAPFVESVPRESLEFTLRKTCKALKQSGPPKGAKE